MMKENLIKKLNVFNYEFKEIGNKVVIKTNSSLEIEVVFNEKKTIINGYLRRLNFLTGIVEMNIKKVYSYTTFVCFIILCIPFFVNLIFDEFIVFNSSYGFFALLIFNFVFVWNCLAYHKYLSDFNNLKSQIIFWLR